MGRIIVTVGGPWSNPPRLQSPLELAFGEGEPEFARDVAALGRRQGTFEPEELAALRRHVGIVQASVEFDAPGSLAHAEAAARFILDSVAQGAVGVFVETGMRVFAPLALKGTPPADPATLLHLFVGIFADGDRAYTEGMCAFDLPDVEVQHPDAAAAQAAAFGLAARMVCDGYRPQESEIYQNSLSAPAFRVTAAPATTDDPEEPVNERGWWRLRPEVLDGV
ncbi:MAG: hypothetical protein R3F60_01105 [bacterium]